MEDITSEKNRTACARLFSEPISLAFSGDLTGRESLFPEEERLIKKATAGRREQFFEGRACAHLAVGKIGLKPAPVLKGKKGEPLWQAGVTGSITHTRGLCAAAVSSLDFCLSLGLDIESRKIRGSERNIARYICREEEYQAMLAFKGQQFLKWSRVVFSAKESFFKCLFPLTGVLFGFKSVCIELERSKGRFTAVIVEPFHPNFPVGYSLKGRFAVTADYVFTGIAALR